MYTQTNLIRGSHEWRTHVIMGVKREKTLSAEIS